MFGFNKSHDHTLFFSSAEEIRFYRETTEKYALCEEYYRLDEELRSAEALRRGTESIIGEVTPERNAEKTQGVEL